MMLFFIMHKTMFCLCKVCTYVQIQTYLMWLPNLALNEFLVCLLFEMFTDVLWIWLQEIYMASTPTSCDSLNMVDFHQRPTISSLAIMLTVANNRWKQFVFSLRIRSNIPKISFCCEEITNVQASTGYMASMMSVGHHHLLFVCSFVQLFIHSSDHSYTARLMHRFWQV